MKNYILKLEDERMLRSELGKEGKYDDKPLYFRTPMAEVSGEWEFIVAHAMRFATVAEALGMLAKEHARNWFNKKDRLFVVDTSRNLEIPVDRDALDVKGKALKAIIDAERKAQYKATQRAARKAEDQRKRDLPKRVKELVPDIPAVTIAIAEPACA